MNLIVTIMKLVDCFRSYHNNKSDLLFETRDILNEQTLSKVTRSHRMCAFTA